MTNSARDRLTSKIMTFLEKASIDHGRLDKPGWHVKLLREIESTLAEYRFHKTASGKKRGTKLPYISDVELLPVFERHCLAAAQRALDSGEYESKKGLYGDLDWFLHVPGRMDDLCLEILNYLESLPHLFDAYFELPVETNIFEDAALTEEISVEKVESADQFRAKFGFEPSEVFGDNTNPCRTFLRIRISGYCSASWQNLTTRRALSIFKVIAQQAVHCGLFNVQSAFQEPYRVYTPEPFPGREFKYISIDRTTRSAPWHSASLPRDVSRLVARLSGKNQGLGRAEFESLVARLRQSAKKMSVDDANVERIRAACQWCFESYASENQTLAFLQLCFALESLFGEADDAGVVGTRTIGDRCAYQSGVPPGERQQIRAKFAEFYAIRSKLVHGTATALESDEIDVFHWGRHIFEQALQTEIQLLR